MEEEKVKAEVGRILSEKYAVRNRWVEHFEKLGNRETENAVIGMEQGLHVLRNFNYSRRKYRSSNKNERRKSCSFGVL